MADVKLKSCPFCGGEAYYRTPTHLKGTAFDVMMVECKQCGASPYAVEVYEYNTEENKRKAIAEVWNRRAVNTTLVHAHWKGYHTQEPYCSNCGFTYDYEQGENAQTTDYCGNCGAKMDENEVENLKHCSCGDRHYCPEVEKDENGKWFIRCHMCHKIVRGNTIEEAVNAWNEGAKTDDETTP